MDFAFDNLEFVIQFNVIESVFKRLTLFKQSMTHFRLLYSEKFACH